MFSSADRLPTTIFVTGLPSSPIADGCKQRAVGRSYSPEACPPRSPAPPLPAPPSPPCMPDTRQALAQKRLLLSFRRRALEAEQHARARALVLVPWQWLF